MGSKSIETHETENTNFTAEIPSAELVGVWLRRGHTRAFRYPRVFISFLKKYLFLAVLCLHCRAGFSLVVESGGYSLVVVRDLIAVAQ